jgi:hypothetical protein
VIGGALALLAVAASCSLLIAQATHLQRELERPLTLIVLATVLALAGGLALGARSAAAQAPPASYSCTPGPLDCSGWHNANVTLGWTSMRPPVVDDDGNCPSAKRITNEGVTTWQCGVLVEQTPPAAPVWVLTMATIRIDKTAPSVTATPSRGPDANGWYRAPLQVAFSGSDAAGGGRETSGVQSCTTPTYSTPDSATASVTGTCTDVAGNTSAPYAFSLRYDATGPAVKSGRPARKPDHGRWYTEPVKWRFRGTDALSGIAECPSVLYGGPDGQAARVTGACRDNAGNVSTRTFSFRYDATPPARPAVRTVPRDHAVRLRIAVAPDVRSIAILRAPGRGGTRDSTIYRGRPRSFTDVHASNGKRYRYTVVARDQAANGSRSTTSAVPNPRLLAPPYGAVLNTPPLLRWTPVRHADYFNVQLRRDGHKVLSRWPMRARLQLRQSWRFRGEVQRLAPGYYVWDVWPGFGSRRAAKYGARIGRGAFVIPGAG